MPWADIKKLDDLESEIQHALEIENTFGKQIPFQQRRLLVMIF